MRLTINNPCLDFWKHQVLTLLLILSAGCVSGQETWSMDQFILTTSDNPIIKYQTEKLNQMANDNYRLPLIERLEFRTETHDFDLEKQEYALRLTTNSLGEAKANADLFESEKELARIHREVILKNELMNRYNIIVSLVFLRDNLSLIHEELALYEAKIKILKTMANWELAEINDLVKTEEEYQEADIERIKIEQALESVQGKIAAICNENVILNTEDLIAPRFIKTHYKDILKQDTVINAEVQALDIEMHQLDLKKTVARKQNNKLMRYYQISFDDSSNPFEQEQIRLGVGILLPVGGSDKRKIAELQYDQLEAQSDYESAVLNMKLDRKDAIAELNNNINEYELLTQHYENSVAKKTLEKYKEIPEISALSVLSLREFDLSQKRKLLKSTFDLYQEYLESIEVYDLINTDNFQNFLSIHHFGY